MNTIFSFTRSAALHLLSLTLVLVPVVYAALAITCTGHGM